ncbi:unnamed protein product [Didymodactylos carnosus]|uniref:Uncharacterized protein n=1 Tax=Didymodactylos carnosus TaxID=1234261 RepID=A0A815BJ43_9BILA|nr:unnamed protein product [Didymodactylos carnosus]CAF1270274.1 unnamed protein product [Didymodactylos carnosus]CAF3724301.1 unnamed protein product [Didymodactylos carnosus]CAF4057891.1 unnamed protein product [Didymodactylos carnosus]
MESDRLVIQKYFERGFSGGQIFQHVKQLGITRSCVYRTIRRLRDTGSIPDHPRSGRPRTCRTKERIKRVREKIRRNPQRSARKLALEEDIDTRSMRRIVQIDLGLKAYKKRKLHGLSTKQMAARLERCKALTVQRFQKSRSTMIWGAISYNGKIPLKFVEKGAKINAEYYQDEILESTLKPNISTLYPDGQWIFQQDSAPAHEAKSTQQWLAENCPDFISSKEWPSSSPDLNPLDFSIWGTLEAIVNAKQHRSLESLERTLVREWNRLRMETQDQEIEQELFIDLPDDIQRELAAEQAKFDYA